MSSPNRKNHDKSEDKAAPSNHKKPPASRQNYSNNNGHHHAAPADEQQQPHNRPTLQSHLQNAHNTIQQATQPLGKAFQKLGAGIEKAAKTAVAPLQNIVSGDHTKDGGRNTGLRKSKGSNRKKLMEEELSMLSSLDGSLQKDDTDDATTTTEYEGNVNAIKFNAYDFHGKDVDDDDFDNSSFHKHCKLHVRTVRTRMSEIFFLRVVNGGCYSTIVLFVC